MIKAIMGAALAIALGTVAASAQDTAKDETKKVKRIILMHQDGTSKDIDMERLHALTADCFEEDIFKAETENEIHGKKQRSKIILCHKGEGDRLAALEKARARLAESDDLGTDPRTRALTALDAEIARLKAE